ncbi:MAG: MBG domain-containing protein, partial [Clostridia bacterium]|nr:MBG domain-containing protein [Clostridia bacterium]
MKVFGKELKTIALALVMSVCLAIGISCNKEVRLVDVDFIIDPDTPKAYTVGEFSYEGYSLVRTYSDGTTETVPFTAEHISDVERMKLWQVGKQTISFEYEGEEVSFDRTREELVDILEFSFDCNFLRHSFDGIELVPIKTTYDGQPHEVVFNTAIPAGTTVTVNNGNSLIYTDAGTYRASVTLSKDGYAPKDLFADVEISKADFDTSTFSFEDKSYQYDKNPHSLEITGKLPQGVSVRYTINGERGNSAVNIGDY